MQELERKALSLGATSFRRSTKPTKKFQVLYKGHLIHFGDRSMQDFTQHKDEQRRKNFRKRMQGVNKGKSWKDKTSPLFWSYHLLW